MSTRGNYGFTENGINYFCYAHYDNQQEYALPILIEFLAEYGYDKYVEQIKNWGIRGGLRQIGGGEEDELGDWFDDHEPEGLWDTELDQEPDNDFGYLVKKDLTIKLFDYGEPGGKFGNHEFIIVTFENNIRDIIAGLS